MDLALEEQLNSLFIQPQARLPNGPALHICLVASRGVESAAGLPCAERAACMHAWRPPWCRHAALGLPKRSHTLRAMWLQNMQSWRIPERAERVQGRACERVCANILVLEVPCLPGPVQWVRGNAVARPSRDQFAFILVTGDAGLAMREELHHF